MKLTTDALDDIRHRLATGDIAVRWHHLKAFGRSSAQGYAALMGEAPEKRSDAIESGSAVDSELLDGIDGNVIPVPEGMRRDARSEDWRKFQGSNPGKIILTRSEYDRVSGMVASVQEDAFAMELLAGQRKTAILWEREDGIMCQSTPDSVGNGVLADLKRTAPGNLPDRFSRHAVNMGWTGQMAWYYEAALAGGDAPQLYFVVVEAEPTLARRRHEVAVFRMTDQVHEEARELVERYWARLMRFLDAGEVAGYADGLAYIPMVPQWKDAS